uniref:Innexin n=1 Tax=Ascaris suum TaxID=6253 RepID=F1LF57_ASCSU
MYLCSTDIIERCNTLCSDPAGDFVDRLSYDYTVRLLVFFAVLVGTKQYFGAPIQCITPSNFPGTWVSYARDYCFVTNTYLLNGTTSHTNAPSHMVVKQGIHYYQCGFPSSSFCKPSFSSCRGFFGTSLSTSVGWGHALYCGERDEPAFCRRLLATQSPTCRNRVI